MNLGRDSAVNAEETGTAGAPGRPDVGGDGDSGGSAGLGGATGSGGKAGLGGVIGSGGNTRAKDSGAGEVGSVDTRLDLVAREAGGDGSTANLTVWLAGDSTVADGSGACPVGWGKEFQTLFNSHVTVTNKAQAGRSVQTWLYNVSTTKAYDGECVLTSKTYLAPWTATLAGVKAGDYLLIQFGINDATATCNRHVGTALFQTYYGMMAQAAKDRGAHPIFVTPVSSIACSGAKAVATRGNYATATKQAGATYDVPVIDLEQLSVALYTTLGFCPLPGPDTAQTFESGAIGAFFCEDHTHFEAAGAAQIATLVAKALRDQGIDLASYLR